MQPKGRRSPVDLPATKLWLWAGSTTPVRDLKETLGRIFGDTITKLTCAIDLKDFLPARLLFLADIIVGTAPLDHPGGATGYQLEYAIALCHGHRASPQRPRPERCPACAQRRLAHLRLHLHAR